MTRVHLGREAVMRIGALARLELTDPELDVLLPQLNAVLEHVAALEAFTEPEPRVEPADPGGGLRRVEPADPGGGLRADVIGPDPLSRGPGDVAPRFVDGFFAVARLQPFDVAADPEATDP